MRGYKAFDKDLKCRGKQYEVGMEYEEDGGPVICRQGMHFCEQLADVFDYYPFDEDKTRVCEVEALGNVARRNGDSTKCCTNQLKIVRELDWDEILKLVNSGIANTGCENSGDYNSGHGNSGDWNSGHFNSGDYNSGLRNSGNRNSGDFNSGNRNSGHGNSGESNSGRENSGDYNSGDYNSGESNSGNANSGDQNSGDWNTGDWNSGRCNSGDWNSGDWNVTDFSSGVLCTETPECLIFDKPSGMTLEEWRDSRASRLLERVPIDASKWVDAIEMTDEEKAIHPEWEVTRGYLREGTYKRDFASWWAHLNNDEKAEIFAIPNFDPDKFERITGLHLHDEIPKTKKKGNGDEAPETTGFGGELIAFLEGHATEEIEGALAAAEEWLASARA